MNRLQPIKATVLDDDKVALLAIPFGGPIPSPKSTKGVDLDGEWFSERTDIKADWLQERLVDWHHGMDRTMRNGVIGKADNLRVEEDGWWVDVWFDHGAKRLELIRRLAERGAQLFGSSESVQGMTKKADTGEILVWPYMRQAISTSPQNTYSVIRPLKAVLEGMLPTDGFWSDVEAAMRDLGSDLRATSEWGELGAKAGRVHSATDMEDFQAAMTHAREALARLEKVVARQPEYGVRDAAAELA